MQQERLKTDSDTESEKQIPMKNAQIFDFVKINM